MDYFTLWSLLDLWEGFGGQVKKAKGLRNTNLYFQNSHGDVKYSLRNIINDVITIVTGGWILD